VDGDLEKEHLGLAAASYDKLCNSSDIIMHCAALVDWAAPLHRSLATNALGSKRIAQLAADARMGKACRLLLVSTAWVHGMSAGRCCELPLVAKEPELEVSRCFSKLEEFQRCSEQQQSEFHQEALLRLGPSAESTKLTDLAEEMRRKWVDAQMAEWGVSRARSCGWWDGYTFSKAIAEMLVRDIQRQIPFAIIRPSGVVSAASEPLPGWVDAYLLVEPLIEGVGRGQITEFPGRKDCVIDCVPVDYVCNVVIAAAQEVGIEAAQEPVKVYQCASGDVFPNSLGEIESTWRQYFKSQPMHHQGKAVQVNPVKFVASAEHFVKSLQFRYITPLHTCSAAVQMLPRWQHSNLLRACRAWLERKRRGLEKVSLLAKLYSTYTLNEWSFQTTNSRQLMSSLCSSDQQRFPYFAPDTTWSWSEFWTQKHIPGMRKWVLKEVTGPTPTPLPARL